MGVLGTMYKLDKQARFEFDERENEDFVNNPIRLYSILAPSDRFSQRPQFDLPDLLFCSQARKLVNTGDFKTFSFVYKYL